MAPIKEETVHLDPGLWIYHDIVSPKEKQDIIKTAGPFVSHFFRLPSPLRLTQFYRIKLVSQEFATLHCFLAFPTDQGLGVIHSKSFMLLLVSDRNSVLVTILAESIGIGIGADFFLPKPNFFFVKFY